MIWWFLRSLPITCTIFKSIPLNGFGITAYIPPMNTIRRYRCPGSFIYLLILKLAFAVRNATTPRFIGLCTPANFHCYRLINKQVKLRPRINDWPRYNTFWNNISSYFHGDWPFYSWKINSWKTKPIRYTQSIAM